VCAGDTTAQTIFVIIMFSKKTLDYVINLVESLIPWLHGNLRYHNTCGLTRPAAVTDGKATMRVKCTGR
jgi:hypothetical protein